MKKRNNSDRIVDLVINVLLAAVGLIAIYPIWYVLIASVSNPTSIAAGKVVLWPDGFNLQAYIKLLDNQMIWKGYFNSICYTLAATALSMFVTVPCAYALSRKDLPGRTFFSTFFIITMYFSGGLIPSFLVINSLGWLNSPLALIVPGAMSVYNMILVKSFFLNSIPDALYDAARIDGASNTLFFIKVVLPLSPAILAVIALFTMTSSWNSYLPAQMYIYDTDLYTLQQVIKGITAEVSTALMENMTTDEISKLILERNLMKYAVVVVGCLPLVLMYPFIQKYFVGGIMLGAVKE